jgi:hypothetical protein
MKRISFSIKILVVILFIGIFQPSCTKLEEEVYSDLTGELFFEDPGNLIYAFGAAYTNLYWLIGHKYGMVGKEAGTDLVVVPQRGGDWFDGGEWHRYHRQTWKAEEGYISFWWNICYGGINKCNQLIDQFKLVEGETAPLAIAELRGLRALYYYWLIDLYGNVPIVDRFDYPADYKPLTNSRAEVFAFIEKELKESMPLLSKEAGMPMYGRINYYTASMILAKLYLNAEVFTGTPKYADALNYCDSIILSNQYELEGDFFNNFVGNAINSGEHIMGVPFDQVNAQGFEVHLFTLHYSLQSKFAIQSSTWNGICAQEAFFNMFDTNDIRRNGLLSGPQFDDQGNPIQDPSYEKFDPLNPTKPRDPDGINLNLTPNLNMLEPNCLRQCGARIAKFPFIAGSDRYMSNDFPIFRYADVMLMKAELLLRTGGDAGEALILVNQIRSRAGIAPLGAVTLEDIHAERAKELYAEGHRRSDMIRFGTYLGTRWEKPDVSPDYVTLWPVPDAAIKANPNLDQNEGY